MNPDEIQEDEPLLLNPVGQIDPNAKKTYSLNTGMSPMASGNIGLSGELMETGPKVKHSKTLAQRGMSLATKGNIDPIALLERAKEQCKQPIKLSWEDLRFEAEV